ncbi:hypothetical protein BDDG_02565 [Blastomyces dermatitidis ATCC 18188]|uniref:Uncharacterized protein n=1 Tax=Ajellomyces dermatitidis (strain ATCC 18188 / CBS 674.68) TaxID=653446 RepID=F2T8R1_AJEDA|nr:hypothetical protein BDDG_02565 [Blastomyces dermatitidis ATCC 18188]
MAGETPKRTRAAAAKAQEKETSQQNTPTKQPDKKTMCEHCVGWIFPRHLEAPCDKVEGSSKPCKNCNHDKKGCAIPPPELKEHVDKLVRTHDFYVTSSDDFKESVKGPMLEAAKDLAKQIKEARARRQEMESVTVAIKSPNTTISVAEKARIEMQKAMVDIEQAKLAVEQEKIAIKKSKLAVEQEKLAIEKSKLAVQHEILVAVNRHMEDQNRAIARLTDTTNQVNQNAFNIAVKTDN